MGLGGLEGEPVGGAAAGLGWPGRKARWWGAAGKLVGGFQASPPKFLAPGEDVNRTRGVEITKAITALGGGRPPAAPGPRPGR